jgi:hypothetical protein
VGGEALGGGGPRGGGRRSELCTDVRPAEPAREDGQAGRAGPGRRVQAGGVSAGASYLGGAAARASAADGARQPGALAGAAGDTLAGGAQPRRLPRADGEQRMLWRQGGDAEAARVAVGRDRVAAGGASVAQRADRDPGRETRRGRQSATSA